MKAWEVYRDRMDEFDFTKRGMRKELTKAAYRRRLKDSLSWHEVQINGHYQEVAIAHTAERDEKKIFAMPDERLTHGGIVDFANNKWLIMELDADNEIYERGLMRQCNYVLKWIGRDGKLKEKWCVVEDGTKYLIGEKNAQIMSIGDARISITVGKDEDTIELSRGMRFLIDDNDSDDVIAYQITKPNKLFNIFNGNGVFRFILNEVNVTDDDNLEQRIADYTNWRPDQPLDGDHRDSALTVVQIVKQANDDAAVSPDDQKEVWL